MICGIAVKLPGHAVTAAAVVGLALMGCFVVSGRTGAEPGSVRTGAIIAAQAVGGEILVSEELRAAASSGNGDSLRFDEGREVELKGLAGSHRVFRADWAPEAAAA